MKYYSYLLLGLFILSISSCEETETITSISKLNDVEITVSFGQNTKTTVDIPLTKQTPKTYKIALKSATLQGMGETADFQLFSLDSLSLSNEYDFTDSYLRKSLLSGDSIPDGEYNAFEVEIYYLEMALQLKSETRGPELRNIRIYLSDDTEFEGGTHQPGDLTQINNNIEIGWLLGEGQKPDLDPVSPRNAAYTHEGKGIVWYDFAGKCACDYGPFGNIEFMNNAPHPIYSQIIPFNFTGGNGTTLVVDFNVAECWQFEDKSNDGYFGFSDLDAITPTRWHMEMPVINISLE